MTRERKELLSKIQEINNQESAELELGAGFFASEISLVFEEQRRPLYEALAATYNMSVDEYYNMQYESAIQTVANDPCVPFH